VQLAAAGIADARPISRRLGRAPATYPRTADHSNNRAARKPATCTGETAGPLKLLTPAAQYCRAAIRRGWLDLLGGLREAKQLGSRPPAIRRTSLFDRIGTRPLDHRIPSAKYRS